MMFSDPASHRKAATPHGSVPINRADFVVPMSIPGTGRDAIVSRSHDADTVGGQDRVAREEYRARVLAEVREDLANRGVDLSAARAEPQRVGNVDANSVDRDVNTTIQSDKELDCTAQAENDVDAADIANSTENTDNSDNTEVTNEQNSIETASWGDWDIDDDDEFDDVFGEDDELADSDDIPEDLDDILSDDLDDIPDDL